VEGILRFAVDHKAGLISVEGSGFWTMDQARDHFVRLDASIRELRAARGQVRVLVDLRDAAPQAQEVAAIVREATGRLYTERDHIAIVIREGISRMQMQRLTQALNAQMFDDPVSAVRWLESMAQP
jgi:hypothetical protein